MTVEGFRASLAAGAPPAGLSPPLRALWHAGRDEWDVAHEIVQAEDSAEAALVHAHLHRVEGDLANAGYWYRRAGRPVAEVSTAEEWGALVAALRT